MNYSESRTKKEIRIVNLDYSKFKLFELSLLWRASIARDPFFRNVNLGPHEERIRKMLLQSDPGRLYEYGCMIIGLTTEEKVAVDIISMPERGRIEGNLSYMFMLGGCMWLYLVSGQTKDFGKQDYFLQTDGSMRIKFFPATSVPYIIGMAKTLLRSGKLT